MRIFVAVTYYKLIKMTTLNLPPYSVRLAGTQERPTIFDVLRRRYVLLANEVRLTVGGKTLRADTVAYDRELKPRMIVEYKAPTIQLTQKVMEQVSAYNLLLHVDFLIVSNGLDHYCCRMNYEQGTYEFLTEIPTYEQIIST